MESFQWNEGFLTGIADVDDQHRHLVDVINKFGDLIDPPPLNWSTRYDSSGRTDNEYQTT